MSSIMSSSEPFAIVVSAPALYQPTRSQAKLSELLVNTKVCHGSEIVSSARSQDANAIMFAGIRVFFHQGGAPSKWSGEFPYAGRLIAFGYYVSLSHLEPGDPPADVPINLWQVTKSIFPDRNLTHILHYRNVGRIGDSLQPLTKNIIGRPPRPGDNYIIVAANKPGHSQLDRLWIECCLS